MIPNFGQIWGKLLSRVCIGVTGHLLGLVIRLTIAARIPNGKMAFLRQRLRRRVCLVSRFVALQWSLWLAELNLAEHSRGQLG